MKKAVNYTFLMLFLLSLSPNYFYGNSYSPDYNIESTTHYSFPNTVLPNLPSSENPHFTSIWAGQNPYQPMNIIINAAQIEGVDLEIDDEIAVFDTDSSGLEICVGTGIVTSTITSTNPLTIVASTDDPITPEIDGFESGNSIIFRVWSETEQLELTDISTSYNPSFDEEFASLGTAIATLSVSIPNGIPVIDIQAAALPDTVTLPNTVDLSVSASDPDNDVLTYSWSKLSGPGDVTFSVNNSVSSDSTTASFSLEGDYTIRVLVYDDEDTVSSDVDVVVLPAPNGIPVIDIQAAALPDTVTLPNTVDLSVSASDPDSDVLTYSWSKLSGPGDVTFSVNNSVSSDSTTASFSLEGDYTIRVLVYDDEDTVSSDVDVVVLPAPNGIPVIDIQAAALPDTVTLPNTVDLSVSASDPDNDVLTYSWSKLSGPGDVTFSVNNSVSSDSTTASFSLEGDYTIRVLVYDDEDTVSSDVDVVVLPTYLDIRTVENITINNGQTECFDATNTIIVAGSGTTVDVLSGGEATFIAGQRIHLKDGFHAHSGSYVHSRITTTGEYCDQQQPLVAAQDTVEQVTGNLPDVTVDEDVDFAIYHNPSLSRSTINFMEKATTPDIFLMNFQEEHILETRVALSQSDVSDLFDLYSANKQSGFVEFSDNLNLLVYPNPFIRKTEVRFNLQQKESVKLVIHNMHGQIIETLYDGILAEGEHHYSWNGKNNLEQVSQPGIYVIKIICNSHTQQKILLKN